MNRYITIVSGLPRSGTSLMMQMLDKGGMEVMTDHIRVADVDNPKGYYEFEKVKKIKENSSWLKDARGTAFKMVSMLLYDLPPNERYKVIFMKRDMAELLASQKKMLKRLNKETGPDDDEMEKLFSEHLEKTHAWLEQQKHIDVLYVNYKQVIESPHKSADTVAVFLDGKLNAKKMAAVVDDSLYRNRN